LPTSSPLFCGISTPEKLQGIILNHNILLENNGIIRKLGLIVTINISLSIMAYCKVKSRMSLERPMETTATEHYPGFELIPPEQGCGRVTAALTLFVNGLCSSYRKAALNTKHTICASR
jgi:hypothetical protein